MQYWIKVMHPWVQNLYPVLGLGSGGRLLRAKFGYQAVATYIKYHFIVRSLGAVTVTGNTSRHDSPGVSTRQAKWLCIRAEKTMTATDVTGFDVIFSTGFFATFSRF